MFERPGQKEKMKQDISQRLAIECSPLKKYGSRTILLKNIDVFDVAEFLNILCIYL